MIIERKEAASIMFAYLETRYMLYYDTGTDNVLSSQSKGSYENNVKIWENCISLLMDHSASCDSLRQQFIIT